MKYPKVVETLDRIIYFIWKQEISYRWTQRITGNSDFLWNPTNFLAIVWQVKHGYLLLYESIILLYKKMSSIRVPQFKMNWLAFS